MLSLLLPLHLFILQINLIFTLHSSKNSFQAHLINSNFITMYYAHIHLYAHLIILQDTSPYNTHIPSIYSHICLNDSQFPRHSNTSYNLDILTILINLYSISHYSNCILLSRSLIN